MGASSMPPGPPGDSPVTEPDPRGRRQWAGALTIEDFRSVRRWLVILGVLLVVTAAVAAYALIKAYDSEQEAADRERVVQLERTLRSRLADLDRALGRTGEESDVVRLQRELRRKAEEPDVARIDRRVRSLEDDVVSAIDTAASTGRQLERLGDRVSALEERRR